MNEKEKIDTYLKLLEIVQTGFDKRKDIEWKVTIALWVGIFAATAFLKENYSNPSCCFLGLLYLLFFILCVLWACSLGGSHETDKRFRQYYRDQIQFNLGKLPSESIEIPRQTFFYLDRWMILELGITCFFLVVSLLILCVLH